MSITLSIPGRLVRLLGITGDQPGTIGSTTGTVERRTGLRSRFPPNGLAPDREAGNRLPSRPVGARRHRGPNRPVVLLVRRGRPCAERTSTPRRGGGRTGLPPSPIRLSPRRARPDDGARAERFALAGEADRFPTPSVGDGLFLAPSTDQAYALVPRPPSLSFIRCGDDRNGGGRASGWWCRARCSPACSGRRRPGYRRPSPVAWPPTGL